MSASVLVRTDAHNEDTISKRLVDVMGNLVTASKMNARYNTKYTNPNPNPILTRSQKFTMISHECTGSGVKAH